MATKLLQNEMLQNEMTHNWQDDLAHLIPGHRRADALLNPRAAFTTPGRVSHHPTLSFDEKRLVLGIWIRDLLADSRRGEDVGAAVQCALAELCTFDPAAALIFRRVFANEVPALSL